MFKWANFSGSLLIRSVYLITIPIVLVQIIGIVIFFELHWDLVLKRSAQSITNEIKILEMNKQSESINNFAKSGVKNMAVVTPAFVSDCLETLEEIGMEAVEDFEENGGEKLHVVPCINDREDWVELLSKWVTEWNEKVLEKI